MNEIISWAIVGPGKIASAMVKDMRSVPGAKVEAVVARTGEKAAAAAKSFGAPRWGTSLETILREGGIDAVYVATPHSAHPDAVETALEHKIPVLCEKPLSAGYHTTRRLVETARENKTLLMEALWSKFHPLLRRVWEFIDHDYLGSVRSMRFEFGNQVPFDPESRLFNPKLGGGVTLDLGIYPLWMPLAFWGEPVHIRAMGNTASTGTDEAAITILQFPRGGLASGESSFMYEMENAAYIHGTKGRIKIESPWYAPNRVNLLPKDDKPEVWKFRSKTAGLNFEVEHFHELIRKGEMESPIHSLDDTLLLSKVMDRIMADI